MTEDQVYSLFITKIESLGQPKESFESEMVVSGGLEEVKRRLRQSYVLGNTWHDVFICDCCAYYSDTTENDWSSLFGGWSLIPLKEALISKLTNEQIFRLFLKHHRKLTAYKRYVKVGKPLKKVADAVHHVHWSRTTEGYPMWVTISRAWDKLVTDLNLTGTFDVKLFQELR